QPRTELGKKAAKALRKQGLVPCNLYGGKETINFSAPYTSLQPIVFTPAFKIAEIELNGKKIKAITKELQFDPVKDTIKHVDFQELVDEVKVKVEVPLKLNGVPAEVAMGAKLEQTMRKLKIFALPKHLPEVIVVEVGDLLVEYVDTRHNIGFKIVEALAAQHKAEFRLDKLAYVAQFRFKGKNITLIKPTTYMNLSGKAVRYWMQEANVKPENMLAILDDLAIPFGTIRLRPKGSDGGHNGLKDIDATLGNNLYPRLRFGIGSNYHKGQQVNYVLGKWSPEENKDLIDKIILATQATESFLFEGLGNAMTKFNK
ncbi:unnamed protein product, partial [Darwinula stevensoni]